jgi:hypothetical protein
MPVAVTPARMQNVSYQNLACNGRCEKLGSDKYVRLSLAIAADAFEYSWIYPKQIQTAGR